MDGLLVQSQEQLRLSSRHRHDSGRSLDAQIGQILRLEHRRLHFTVEIRMLQSKRFLFPNQRREARRCMSVVIGRRKPKYTVLKPLRRVDGYYVKEAFPARYSAPCPPLSRVQPSLPRSLAPQCHPRFLLSCFPPNCHRPGLAESSRRPNREALKTPNRAESRGAHNLES